MIAEAKTQAARAAYSALAAGGCAPFIQHFGSVADEAGVAEIAYQRGAYGWVGPGTWTVALAVTPYAGQRGLDGDLKSVQAAPGTIQVIPPDTHFSFAFEGAARLRYLSFGDKCVLEAGPEALPAACVFEDLFAEFRSPIVSSLVNRVVDSSKAHLLTPPDHTRALVSAAVSELMILGRAQARGRTHTTSKLDTSLLDYLEEQTARDPRVVPNAADLAKEYGLSASSFGKAFRDQTSTTPFQYGLGLRIKTARAMIESSEHSLAQVAFASGFSSQSHMTDVFRARVGKTPGALRAEHKRHAASTGL